MTHQPSPRVAVEGLDCPIGSVWQGRSNEDIRVFEGAIAVAPELVEYSRRGPRRRWKRNGGQMKLQTWKAWLSGARRIG